MICPLCGQQAQRFRISHRMVEIAKRPRPSVRGTSAAKKRAQQAARARWQRVKQGNKPS